MQREVIKKLLAKLQESESTVITLYYLGGMTYEEISKFLGVSVGAIIVNLIITCTLAVVGLGNPVSPTNV